MQDRIRRVIGAHGKISVDATTVGATEDLFGLGLTSHASVNVMLALEDEFDIEFPDSDLKKSTFATVATLEDVVRRLASA